MADTYHGNVDLSQYWVSEKFDGVRGYWNGEKMLTRGGNIVDIPAWFIQDWPKTPMDGELWTGYGKFSEVSVIVRTAEFDDPAWHKVTYQIFDLPRQNGNFDERVTAIRETVALINKPWVLTVKQFRVADEMALQTALKAVLNKGGEGLMLHRGSAYYQTGRNSGLLKVKPYEDAEARVVTVNPGKGRLRGLMGSLNVRTASGLTFAVGTGFSDEERADPPAIGSWITYRYNGRTASGLPRFARFLRMRPGGAPPQAAGDP